MELKEKIKAFCESIGLSIREFERACGLSRGNISNMTGALGSDKLSKIIDTYPELNIYWLLSDRGSMLQDIQADTAIAYKSNNGIPLIPLNAVAGMMSGNSAQIMEYDCDYYDVPLFRGADFLINVTGDSMMPKYYSGDIVACRRLSLDTFFQWNKVYVVDSEQGIIIKRVRQGNDDDHILLVSENPDYAPFPLHRKEIYSIALVMGLVRAE